MFWTRARIIRWVILLVLGVVAIVICWHDPVYAGSRPALVPVADGATVIGTAPQVRLAEFDPPAPGHASITALLIGAGIVALLFTAITLVTFRRR